MPLPSKFLREVQPRLPLLSRLRIGAKAYFFWALVRLFYLLRSWHRSFRPTGSEPNATKTYKIRPHLPIRIFVPATKSSATNLQTLFTIHGGGFTIGTPMDDDKWNRAFADTHGVLVVALNYSKAPFYPYPTAINDLEALISVILADTTIPIDKNRCAIAGFSAGGNLSLAVAQLEGVKAAFKQYDSPGLNAAIPIYAGLDRTVHRDHKATLRQYKPGLTPRRNAQTDLLVGVGKIFDWSYIPVGHNLRDPLVSPIFASRESLPPHIFMIACELDLSSHDAWRMACQLAGRPEPSMDEKTGREECGKVGELELDDERFAWEDKERGIRWLLIPDSVHGFDHLPPRFAGDETSVRDAAEKNVKVIQEVGDWLNTRVWVA